MKRWLALLVVIAAAAYAAAALSPSTPLAGVQNAYAKPCYAGGGYVHAVFPWGHRCIRAGQYCKKSQNPQYHRYGFQCVNGELRKKKKAKK